MMHGLKRQFGPARKKKKRKKSKKGKKTIERHPEALVLLPRTPFYPRPRSIGNHRFFFQTEIPKKKEH
jgi:hypothetical protein